MTKVRNAQGQSDEVPTEAVGGGGCITNQVVSDKKKKDK